MYNSKDMKKQGIKALKYLQDIDRDDVLGAVGLQDRSPWGSALGSIGIFALGCLVGAGVGLAFAPKAGTEFRNDLGERIRKRADELKPVVEEYTGRPQMPVT